MDVPLGVYPWEQNLQTQITVNVKYSVKKYTENVEIVLSKQHITTIYIVFCCIGKKTSSGGYIKQINECV